MNMWKKAAALLLAAVISAGMLSGCSSNSLPKIEVSSMADLANLKIGAQSGTTGEDLAKEYSSDAANNVKGYRSGMDAALALKAGNIDCIILDELPAQSIVKENDTLTIFDPQLEGEDYAIAVRKEDTELLEAINASLAKMKENGTYDTLLATLASDDWKGLEDKSAGNSDVIKMGTNAEFPPFEFLDGTDVVGFDIAMCREIAADSGKKLEVTNMAFDGLIMALQSNNIDMIAAGMTVTAERLEEVSFSDSYYTSKQVIILRK